MDIKEIVKQYASAELCAKWDNNIPLSEISGGGFILSADYQDILGVQEYWGIDTDGMTGIIYRVGDGDFDEVYVTESAKPYMHSAIYHPLEYYL